MKLKSQVRTDSWHFTGEAQQKSLCFLNIWGLLPQIFKGPSCCSLDLIIALNAIIRKAQAGIPPPRKHTKAQETKVIKNPICPSRQNSFQCELNSKASPHLIFAFLLIGACLEVSLSSLDIYFALLVQNNVKISSEIGHESISLHL